MALTPEKVVTADSAQSLPLVHIVGFAAYPTIFLFAHNIAETRPGDMAFPLVVTLVGSLVALAIIRLLLQRDVDRAALVTSAWLLLFFSYGHVYLALQESLPVVGRHRFLMIVWIALGVFSFTWARRLSTSDTVRATRLANTVSVGLIALVVAQVVFFHMRHRTLDIVEKDGPAGAEALVSRPRTTPDIYFIILDGYASEPVLTEVFGLDNSPFIEHLVEQDFTVIADGHSNYAHTFQSLASTLRMDYLTDLEGQDPQMAKRTAFQWIENSEVLRFLQQRDYQFVQIGTSWSVTSRNRFADRQIRCAKANEFLTVLIPTTMLNPLKMKIRTLLYDYADEILCGYQALEDSIHLSGPKFVFAHLVAPHPPYVFRRDGSQFEDYSDYVGTWLPPERYVDQLLFVNTRTERALDLIISVDPEAVIVVQGDHGPATTIPSDAAWQTPTPLQVRERMGILNAVRAPRLGDRGPIASTPVNTFRVLFQEYFGAALPPLPDRNFFSPAEDPFELIEATEILTLREPAAAFEY